MPATELAVFRGSARERWPSAGAGVVEDDAAATGFGAGAGGGCAAALAFASSARFNHGFTVGGAASCNATGGFGDGSGDVSFDFFSPLTVVSLFCEVDWRSLRSAIHAGSDVCDLVSQVVSDEPLVGTEDVSSSLVVVLDDAAKSGEDTPEVPLRGLSSDFARSTALSFNCEPLLGSGATFAGSRALSPTLSSTSSAQFPPDVNSENVLVAGVAVPDVTLLGGADGAGTEGRLLAACAYEKPPWLELTAAILQHPSD